MKGKESMTKILRIAVILFIFSYLVITQVSAEEFTITRETDKNIQKINVDISKIQTEEKQAETVVMKVVNSVYIKGVAPDFRLKSKENINGVWHLNYESDDQHTFDAKVDLNNKTITYLACN